MIKNWQHLCIYGRLASEHADATEIVHDGKHIWVCRPVNDYSLLEYTDMETGEVLLIQGEDGMPTYTSNWADSEPENPYQIA